MNNADSVSIGEDGLVVIEAEDAEAIGKWDLRNINGDKGQSLYWDSRTDSFGSPKDTLKYHFTVDQDGDYFLTIRSYRPETGEPGDRNNDFFVALKDESGNTLTSPTKIFFSGSREKWSWAETFDKNHKKSSAQFSELEPGEVYTLEVSGRSRDAAFDRIHLSEGGRNKNENESASQKVAYSNLSEMPGADPDPAPTSQPDNEPQESSNFVFNPENPGAINQFDHILFHFDGNNNDPDDIAALAVAAALIKASGLEDKATFFYGNNLGEPNESWKLEAMRESAAFAESLGIATVDIQANINGATNTLANILNSGEQVLSLEGGPMEAIYRGLEKTSSENLDNITLISHSGWNENRDVTTRPGVNDVRTWSDAKRDFPDVTYIDIRDQNNGSNNDKGFNSNLWSWLDNTDDPVLQDMRDLMENARGKVNDPSDAGMLFYALTGNENGTPEDAKQFFAANPFSSSSYNPPGNTSDLDSQPEPQPQPEPEPTEPVATEPVGDATEILDFYLVNTDTDQMITKVGDGQAVDADDLTGRSVSVYALAKAGAPNIGSVQLTYNGSTQTENVSPYALFGDKNGNFSGDAGFDLGNNDIQIKVFSGTNGSGVELASTDFNFVVEPAQAEPPVSSPEPDPEPNPDPGPDPVVDEPDTTIDPPPVASPPTQDDNPDADPTDPINNPGVGSSSPQLQFFLADADTDELLVEIEAGDRIDQSVVLGRNTTLVALDSTGLAADNIGSVKLTMDGESQHERFEPYSLYGDKPKGWNDQLEGDLYKGQTFDVGLKDIKVEVFDKASGKGDPIDTINLTFEIVETAADSAEDLVSFSNSGINETEKAYIESELALNVAMETTVETAQVQSFDEDSFETSAVNAQIANQDDLSF